MLSSKQRAYLRGLSNNLKPITQVGKDGVNERFVEQLKDILEKHELVKISILNNSLVETKEAAYYICKATKAETVQVIGNKVVIYKKAEEEPKIVLPRR